MIGIIKNLIGTAKKLTGLTIFPIGTAFNLIGTAKK